MGIPSSFRMDFALSLISGAGRAVALDVLAMLYSSTVSFPPKNIVHLAGRGVKGDVPVKLIRRLRRLTQIEKMEAQSSKRGAGNLADAGEGIIERGLRKRVDLMRIYKMTSGECLT